jgi:hypothetical protein
MADQTKASRKNLTDAKAAASSAVSFGLETGQGPVDDAHTPKNASFNTGAQYLAATPLPKNPAEPQPQ